MAKQRYKVSTTRTVDSSEPVLDRPLVSAGPSHHDLYRLVGTALCNYFAPVTKNIVVSMEEPGSLLSPFAVFRLTAKWKSEGSG